MIPLLYILLYILILILFPVPLINFACWVNNHMKCIGSIKINVFIIYASLRLTASFCQLYIISIICVFKAESDLQNVF